MDDSGDNDDEYKTTIFEVVRGGACPGLCREELGCRGVHFIWGTLECGDAEQDEAGEHGDLEDDPERRPYVRRHSGVHDVPLRRVRVVGFAEVLVVRDVPWIYLSV